MQNSKAISLTIIVAALGYFVDIYDLLLFGIVRVQSLKDLGIPDQQLMSVGIQLINFQMAGLLLGGLLWGVLGDKKGRLSVLFGSILLYSLANLANAFVQNETQYAALRFIAGIGLAGELGAAITLVSELMSKEKRGLGTSFVAAVGILGAVFAAVIADWFHWRTAYLIGGIMGLGLLVLRVRMFESGLYEKTRALSSNHRGNVLLLIQDRSRLWKYISCILIGVPIWFVIGILITFSPELSKHVGVQEPVRAGTSIMMAYIGLSAGDLISGLLSQWVRSRKKVVSLFLGLVLMGVLLYINVPLETTFAFYSLCLFLGFSSGYWALFVTIGAEQFGTNLRATVATSVPNFVRGAVVPLTLSFEALTQRAGWTMLSAAGFVGAVTLGLAALALWSMRETFALDLNYLEGNTEPLVEVV